MWAMVLLVSPLYQPVISTFSQGKGATSVILERDLAYDFSILKEGKENLHLETALPS